MSEANITRKIEQALAIPDTFTRTALAFPEQVERGLALLDRPEVAAEILRRADLLATYGRRVKADKQLMNAIGHGRLKIVARIAELCPARPRNDRGQGRKGKTEKSTSGGEVDFADATIAKY